MPTGSGKTIISYLWAKIYFNDLPIIMTSPTKAISIEKYYDLKKQGIVTNLITGDVKIDNDSNISIMTQEIYNNEYTHKLAAVIIDEFHYVFNNSDRARSYIEALEKTNTKSKILLMSATIAQVNDFTNWLNKLTNRDFIVAKSEERLTKLNYESTGINIKDVKDAIIFCFSRKEISIIIDELISKRSTQCKNNIDIIVKLATTYNIEYMNEWSYGISKYHGKLLPKEKAFVEYIFRHNYINTIVGTDSLALGVNLPIKYSIISNIYKTDGKIKASEFHQLAGRAGRKGFFDIGIATFLKNSPVANYDCGGCRLNYDLKKEFIYYSKKKIEKPSIAIDYDYYGLINGKFNEDEYNDVLRYTYPTVDKSIVDFENICYVKNYYYSLINYNLNKDKVKIQKLLFKRYYLPEWDMEKNGSMSNLLVRFLDTNNIIDVTKIISSLEISHNAPKGVLLQELLLLVKYLRRINEDEFSTVKLINYDKIIDTINNIDETVFNPDLRIGGIDQ